MPPALTTRPDDPHSTTILDLPRLEPNAGSAIPLSLAATRMGELMDADGVPLEGDALLLAAQNFADSRGLVLADVPENADDTARVRAVSEALELSSHPGLRAAADAEAERKLLEADLDTKREQEERKAEEQAAADAAEKAAEGKTDDAGEEPKGDSPGDKPRRGSRARGADAGTEG